MHEKIAGSMSAEEIQARADSIPSNALAKIYSSHSEVDREKFYQEIADGGSISQKEAMERAKSPEVKLSKAQELLAQARIRK